MGTARETILRRVRAALRDLPAGEQPDDVPIAREYRHADLAPQAELVTHFVERVREYRAVVRLVAPGEVAAAVAEACAARGVQRLVVPADLPPSWLPAGVTLLHDHELDHAALDASDAVLTACALGIAQTGTIVLDGGPGQGRRASTLVPDYHLCVIRSNQIVGLVPEAVARLAGAVRDLHRPLTWISGPSATSDIELSRVEGVHGPRTLEVLLIDE